MPKRGRQPNEQSKNQEVMEDDGNDAEDFDGDRTPSNRIDLVASSTSSFPLPVLFEGGHQVEEEYGKQQQQLQQEQHHHQQQQHQQQQDLLASNLSTVAAVPVAVLLVPSLPVSHQYHPQFSIQTEAIATMMTEGAEDTTSLPLPSSSGDGSSASLEQNGYQPLVGTAATEIGTLTSTKNNTLMVPISQAEAAVAAEPYPVAPPPPTTTKTIATTTTKKSAGSNMPPPVATNLMGGKGKLGDSKTVPLGKRVPPNRHDSSKSNTTTTTTTTTKTMGKKPLKGPLPSNSISNNDYNSSGGGGKNKKRKLSIREGEEPSQSQQQRPRLGKSETTGGKGGGRGMVVVPPPSSTNTTTTSNRAGRLPLKHRGSTGTSSRIGNNSRISSSTNNIIGIDRRKIPKLVIVNDEEPDRLVNPLLTMVPRSCIERGIGGGGGVGSTATTALGLLPGSNSTATVGSSGVGNSGIPTLMGNNPPKIGHRGNIDGTSRPTSTITSTMNASSTTTTTAAAASIQIPGDGTTAPTAADVNSAMMMASAAPGSIPVGELLNSASIVFHRPDTYPLSFLARLLGFDVKVPSSGSGSGFVGVNHEITNQQQQQSPTLDVSPIYPTPLPDPQTLPLLQDTCFLNIPPEGRYFEQQRLQQQQQQQRGKGHTTTTATTLGDEDDRRILHYIDPVYSSLLKHGWDTSRCGKPCTPGMAQKFYHKQYQQRPIRDAVVQLAQQTLGMSCDWTFQDWVSYSTAAAAAAAEQEQDQPQQSAEMGGGISSMSSSSSSPTAMGVQAIDNTVPLTQHQQQQTTMESSSSNNDNLGGGPPQQQQQQQNIRLQQQHPQYRRRKYRQSVGPLWTMDGKHVFGHLPQHVFGIVALYQGQPVALFKYQFQWYQLPNIQNGLKDHSDNQQQRLQDDPLEAELVMIVHGIGHRAMMSTTTTTTSLSSTTNTTTTMNNTENTTMAGSIDGGSGDDDASTTDMCLRKNPVNTNRIANVDNLASNGQTLNPPRIVRGDKADRWRPDPGDSTRPGGVLHHVSDRAIMTSVLVGDGSSSANARHQNSVEIEPFTQPTTTTLSPPKQPSNGSSSQVVSADVVSKLDDTVRMVMFALALEHTRACDVWYGLWETPEEAAYWSETCFRMVQLPKVVPTSNGEIADPSSRHQTNNNNKYKPNGGDPSPKLQSGNKTSIGGINNSDNKIVQPMICDLKKCSSRYAILKFKEVKDGKVNQRNGNDGNKVVGHETSTTTTLRERLLVNLPSHEDTLAFFERRIARVRDSVTLPVFTSAGKQTQDTSVRIRAKMMSPTNTDHVELIRLNSKDDVEEEQLKIPLSVSSIVDSLSANEEGHGKDGIPSIAWKVFRCFPIHRDGEVGGPQAELGSEVLDELKKKQEEVIALEKSLEPTVRGLLAKVFDERLEYEQPESIERRTAEKCILRENQAIVERRKELDKVWQDQLEQDMNAVCSICNDGEVTPDNQILFCEACNVAVHQMCYGIEVIPEGDYYCIPCRYFKRDQMIQSSMSVARPRDPAAATPRDNLPPLPIVCQLCPVKQGAYTRSDTSNPKCSVAKWVHMTCAKWQGLDFVKKGGAELVEDVAVLKAHFRRKEISCCICKGMWGAYNPCRHEGCENWMHVTCARESGLCEVIHGENVEGDVEENPWTLLCPDHSIVKEEEDGEGKPRVSLEQLIRAAKEFPVEPMPPPLLESFKPFNKLNAKERSIALNSPEYEATFIEEVLTKKLAGVRCEVCDMIEDDNGKNLSRCSTCGVVVCFSCQIIDDQESQAQRSFKCLGCRTISDAQNDEGIALPVCNLCPQKGGQLMAAQAKPVLKVHYWKKNEKEFRRSLFAKINFAHSLCAFWAPNLQIDHKTCTVDCSNVVLAKGDGFILNKHRCGLCGFRSGLKVKCATSYCRARGEKSRLYNFHVTCARQAGFEVAHHDDRDPPFFLNCYVHGSNEHNLRARLEDLIETEKRRAGKKFYKSDAPMTFSDGSRLMNGAIMVVRILGWAWRWAEWWVEYGSTWEPLLEPGQKESKMSAAELRIVESSRVSRCDDARRCRLAAFGAALRNRCYDIEESFDNPALDRALRAVLHTRSLVGPLELFEIDFFAEWLGRAYRSKSRLLGLGDDKIAVIGDAFCLHEADKSAKFELGDRSLPGKEPLPSGQIFEPPMIEPDDFLHSEPSEAGLEMDLDPIVEVDYKHKGRKASNVDAENSRHTADATNTEYETAPTKKARTTSAPSAQISDPSSPMQSPGGSERLGMEHGSMLSLVPPTRDKELPAAEAEICYDLLKHLDLAKAINRRVGRPPKSVKISIIVLVDDEYYDPRDGSSSEAAKAVDLNMEQIETEKQLENNREKMQCKTQERIASSRKRQFNNASQENGSNKFVYGSPKKRQRYSILATSIEKSAPAIEKNTSAEEYIGTDASSVTQKNELTSSEMSAALAPASKDTTVEPILLENRFGKDKSNQIIAYISSHRETPTFLSREVAKNSPDHLIAKVDEPGIQKDVEMVENSARATLRYNKRQQSATPTYPAYQKPRRSAAPKTSMKEVDTDDDDDHRSDDVNEGEERDHVEREVSQKDPNEMNSEDLDGHVVQKQDGIHLTERTRRDVNSNSTAIGDDLKDDQIAEILKNEAASRQDISSPTRTDANPKEVQSKDKRRSRTSNVTWKDSDDLVTSGRRPHRYSTKPTLKPKCVTLESSAKKLKLAEQVRSRSELTEKGLKTTLKVCRKMDPLYVVKSVGIAFLEGYCGIKSADAFINAKTSTLATAYATWREKESLPKLAGSGAGATISAWKTKVREAARLAQDSDVTNVSDQPDQTRQSHTESCSMTKSRKSRRSVVLSSEGSTSSDEAKSDGSDSDDECMFCHDGGDLLLCDGCERACHLTCLDPPLKEIPGGDWYCPQCTKKQIETETNRMKPGEIGIEETPNRVKPEEDQESKSNSALGVFAEKKEETAKDVPLEMNRADSHKDKIQVSIATMRESDVPSANASIERNVNDAVDMDDQAIVDSGAVPKDTNFGVLALAAPNFGRF